MSENRAIDVNSLNGNLFPVSIEYSRKEGLYCLYLAPISVGEMISLLPARTYLIFNVDAHEFNDSEQRTSLLDFVEKYSSFLTAFDDETLLIEKEQIIDLLTQISHYNLCLIQTEKDIDLDKVIQILGIADEWNKSAVIDQVVSDVFISSHDDCYLYIETRDEKLAKEMLSLQIKTLVNTVAVVGLNSLDFDPEEIILDDQFSIVIPQTQSEGAEEIGWQILEGKFREFIRGEEMTMSGVKLVYSKSDRKIKIEKIRSGETPD